MLTIAIETGTVTLADNAAELVFNKGDLIALPVSFTRGGVLIAPPDGLALAVSLVTRGSRGGNGILASATTFTPEAAGVGAALVSLDLTGAGVTAAFAAIPSEIEADLQARFTAEGFTRHTGFVPARILNNAFSS
jgi:hypothetical protein